MKKRKYDHITPVIYELHWLPLEFRIQYKLAVLAFRHFEGTLPTYLSATLCTYKPARSLRSSAERLLKSPRVDLSRPVNAPFILLLRLFGIRFQTASVTYIRFLSSKSNLKLIFFFKLFWIHRCNLFVFIVCAPWVPFEDCAPQKNPPLFRVFLKLQKSEFKVTIWYTIAFGRKAPRCDSLKHDKKELISYLQQRIFF